ncbi:MAG TPA: hypothetical protein VNW46_12980 [Gemmatimonadaceae bacterium]|nr:hypothetical protein [Gemmatimonadaceae bacterium]
MLTRALLATLVTAVVTALSVTPFRSGAGTRGSAVTVDTIVHDAALIGNLERDATGHRVWLDGAEPRVGTVAGRRSRPLVTFDISAIPSGATIVDALLLLDQCAAAGTPFAGAAHVVIDHLIAATAPDSATFDVSPAGATIAALPADLTPGRRAVPVTTSVATDYAALRALTQFRLRLEGRFERPLENAAGYVAFRGDGDDDCPAVPEAAPMLIVTYRR